MYRVWHSSEGFADYIIEKTNLKQMKYVTKTSLIASDASNGREFHKTPDHIKDILYLDCPDIIVEKNGSPIFSIEISTEAGTGHNVFQRFARLAASVENNIPSFYIYPKGAIITRNGNSKWDILNPLIFKALESMRYIYKIPVLFYYFPSDIDDYIDNPEKSPNFHRKGLKYDLGKFRECPSSNDSEMKNMFTAINEILSIIEKESIEDGIDSLISKLTIRDRFTFMDNEFSNLVQKTSKSWKNMSPLTSTLEVPTEYVLNYITNNLGLNSDYFEDTLLNYRDNSVIYMANAKFRGDPYPGCLSAIDYLTCREGKTYEERKNNLILVFGNVELDKVNKTIKFTDKTNKGITVNDFSEKVKNSSKHNLLTKDYKDLDNEEIPRYYMQVRHGSKFSKTKEIRVYAYFADVIIFPDGVFWREG